MTGALRASGLLLGGALALVVSAPSERPTIIPAVAWAQEQVEVSGIRATRGGAVDCPVIRDATGGLHPVSHLPASIAIGAPVTVRGTYAIMTTCRGKVIRVEEVVPRK